MKKNKMHQKDEKSTLFFELGLVATLGLLLVAFNWNSKKSELVDLGLFTDFAIEDQMVQTSIKEEIKPPPPPPKPQIVTQLEVVDNKSEDSKIDVGTEYKAEEPQLSTVIPDEVKEEPEEEIFVQIPQVQASFPGGDENLVEFIQSNIKYPEQAKRYHVEGRVMIMFTVNSKGKIENIKVLRSLDEMFTQEAIRIINLMPDWIPAQQGNQKVSTNVVLPFKFSLRN